MREKRQSKIWSQSEKDFISTHYEDAGAVEVQKLLNAQGFERTVQAVRYQASTMGVKRPGYANRKMRGVKRGPEMLYDDEVGNSGARRGSLSLSGRHHDDRKPILPPKEFQKKTELYLGLPMFTWPSTSQGVGEILRVVNKVLSSGVQGTELCEDAKKFLGSVAICMNKLGERIAEQCK